MHVSINRKQGCSNVLECVESGDRAEPGDDEDAIDLFTTKVQRLRLITWCDEGVGEAPSYSIWLIDPEDEDHLKIYPLDEAVIAKAIEARELGGEIRRGWFFGWYTRVLRITSEPAELRRYLAQAGRTCFDRGSPAWTMTRVVEQQ